MGATPKEEFFELAARAARSSVEVTALELFNLFDADDGANSTLAKLAECNALLSGWGLCLAPALTDGELDTRRCLRFANRGGVSIETIREEIAAGEMASREFKSSLLFDYARYEAKNDTPQADLRSDRVLFSSLKSVAALMNANGGVLYIGVKDNGEILGLEADYPYVKNPNPDGWQLFLRDQIKGKFKEGDSINNFVDVECPRIGEHHIARIEIGRRSKLSFVKDGSQYQLYTRQGNRTVKVEIDEIEEFIETRKRQGE